MAHMAAPSSCEKIFFKRTRDRLAARGRPILHSHLLGHSKGLSHRVQIHFALEESGPKDKDRHGSQALSIIWVTIVKVVTTRARTKTSIRP